MNATFKDTLDSMTAPLAGRIYTPDELGNLKEHHQDIIALLDELRTLYELELDSAIAGEDLQKVGSHVSNMFATKSPDELIKFLVTHSALVRSLNNIMNILKSISDARMMHDSAFAEEFINAFLSKANKLG